MRRRALLADDNETTSVQS